MKTGQLNEPQARLNILVNRSNFVGAPTTLLVALAWILPERNFHGTCLVIPTDVLPSVAATVSPYYELHFRPAGSRRSSRLDRYRIPL